MNKLTSNEWFNLTMPSITLQSLSLSLSLSLSEKLVRLVPRHQDVDLPLEYNIMI